jgi:hypothetical protein
VGIKGGRFILSEPVIARVHWTERRSPRGDVPDSTVKHMAHSPKLVIELLLGV